MTTSEKPAWALALKARREEVVGSQEDLAVRSEISQSLISQLERGVQHPSSVAVERFARLLDALRWTVAEFEEATGLNLGLVPPGATTGLMPPMAPRLIVHAGSVGAGLNPNNGAMDYPEKRWTPNHPALEGYHDEDLVTLDVVGDSMVCEDVRLAIPEGSTVYLHVRLEPQPGDIVAVWLERDQRGVLKIYRPNEAGHVILQSYNDHHRPIVLSPDDRDYLQGVYLAHITGGRRAHHAKTRYRK